MWSKYRFAASLPPYCAINVRLVRSWFTWSHANCRNVTCAMQLLQRESKWCIMAVSSPLQRPPVVTFRSLFMSLQSMSDHHQYGGLDFLPKPCPPLWVQGKHASSCSPGVWTLAQGGTLNSFSPCLCFLSYVPFARLGEGISPFSPHFLWTKVLFLVEWKIMEFSVCVGMAYPLLQCFSISFICSVGSLQVLQENKIHLYRLIQIYLDFWKTWISLAYIGLYSSQFIRAVVTHA